MKKGTKILLLLFSSLFSQLISGFYATYKIADYFNNSEELLGKAGFLGMSDIYQPFAWISWYNKFGKSTPEFELLFTDYGITNSFISFSVCFLLTTFILMKMNPTKLDSHGSAHFATKQEIYDFGYLTDNRQWWEKLGDFFSDISAVCTGKKSFGKFFNSLFGESRKLSDNNLLTGEGVFLGYLDDGTYLRDNAKTHLLICAPTRSGKGVGHIIPTLLTWKGSCVVTDIKGENWELTSGYRKSQMNNMTFMFKPTSKDSCSYNPLAEIRIGTVKEMGDLQLITKILVDPTGKGSEGENSHWINNAWNLLQGVVLHLLYQKRYYNRDVKGNPCPGTIANMSDVLDFLYDQSDGARVEHNLNNESTPVATTETVNAVDEDGTAFSYDVLTTESQVNQEIIGGVPDYISSDDEYYSGAPIDFNSENPLEEFLKVESFLGGYEKKLQEDEVKMYASGGDISSSNIDPDLGEMKGDLAGLQNKLQNILFKARIDEETGREVPFCHAPPDDVHLFERLYPDKKSRYGMHPHIRQIFQSMIDKPDKEFGSVLSTLDTALIIYRNPVIVKNVSRSDFVMKDIMDCKQPISVYLVFGPGEIDVVRPLVRVIVEALWRQNTEEMKFAGGKTVDHQHRLLMLLDEFPALGKMEALEVSEGFIAGYGMKAMIITQDLNQINKLYGKDNYVVSNCQVQVYHTPSDNNSGEYLSKKMGNKTIETDSFSYKGMIPFSDGRNRQKGSRPLMYPDEVNQMSDKKLLLFCKGLAPVFCNKIRYYEDPVFAPRVKIKHPPNTDHVTNDDRKWDFEEYALLEVQNNSIKNLDNESFRFDK